MKWKWAIVIFTGILLVTGTLLAFNGHVRGAAKLALTTSPIVTLSSADDTTTVMAKVNDGAGFQDVLSHVEADGWIFEEQVGSMFLYSKGEESLVIMLKMWTNQYIVAEMTKG
ncbi:hypothetical protein AB685_11045 [Bacillus sp. LL01]|uniref:hypothetical protein n=1 Tax=Bacillus sp. LL01 TaxID=1665556 RepID=UPI00064D1BC1|nr:hypothetical protein [Bacillus sp. LL01]KMJ58419.1 hypothetical protein AB685_11045 [Bacillus sp. LL01]